MSDLSGKNLIGLPVRGQFIDGSKVVDMTSVISGVEDRGDSVVLIVPDVPSVPANVYSKSDGMTHEFKLKVYPYEE